MTVRPLVDMARDALADADGNQDLAVAIMTDRLRNRDDMLIHIAEVAVSMFAEFQMEKAHGQTVGSA